MHVETLQIHKESKLLKDYRNNAPSIMKFFDYHPYNDFQPRVEELMDRSYDRGELSDLLHEMNRKWSAPASSLANIDRLKQQDSVVVVGGQQAGILTGPMFTINKMISIIQLAKQQEKELNIPVIPVFWMAGEDHDFAEINHIFVPDSSKMKKFKLFQQVAGKQSVSEIGLDKESTEEWVNQLFEQLEETTHTKGLYQSILSSLEQANSYTDFFANLVYRLFPEEGLVLIDSADKELRRMEGKHFISLIQNQTEISSGTYDAAERLKKLGYSNSLDLEENDGHLFYHKNGERILLVRDEEGMWAGKQNEIRFTSEELQQIANNHPENLSNNVVTRPIMQELLFPTLAFIGGPGEVGYWAVLKPAFKALQLKMPPVLPRLSFTFVERHVEKALTKYGIKLETAVSEGVENHKQIWLKQKQDPPIHELSEEIKRKVTEAHQPLREAAKGVRADLGDLAMKNLSYLQDTIQFLEKRIIKSLEENYARELAEFDLITMSLRPEDGFQERMWNPIFWINRYGVGFITDLTNKSLSIEEKHFGVWI